MARRRLTVKRLDPWSVLKFGFLANLCLLAIGLLGSVVAWFFVNRLDLINKACDVAVSVGFESCGVDGGNLFRLVLLLGLLGVVIQTGVLVFLSFLHNLIADLVGGLQISVLDEAVGATQRATAQVQASRKRPAPIGSDRTEAQPPRHPQLPVSQPDGAAGGPESPAPPPQRPSSAGATASRTATGASARPSSDSAAPEPSRGGQRRRGPSTESVFGGRGETGPIRRAESVGDDDRDEGRSDDVEAEDGAEASEGRRGSTWTRRPGRGEGS